jgi:hypothetical protein
MHRLSSRRSVGINPALNPGEALLMPVHHTHNRDHATDEDGDDRYQQRAQPKDRINESVHFPSTPPTSVNNSCSGGADRDRTGGLLVANQALSQLSYSPTTTGFNVARFQCFKVKDLETLKLWHLETLIWWAWVELNYRPHPYQGCALAT